MLPEGTFLLLLGGAGLVTAAWMLRPFDQFPGEARAIAPTTLIATTLWGIVALEGGSVTRTTQCCRYTSELPAVQYFAAGMSILSFIAFILWYFDEFPPDDEELGEPTAADGGQR